MAHLRAEGSTPSLLMHVGYHKTGTTWLQRFLFRNEAAGFRLALPISQVVLLIARVKPLQFDHEKTRAILEQGISSVPNHLSPVISAERLSGNPHSGGYDSDRLAELLHRLLPQGKVLIVIRDQADAILSVYREYVLKGGRRTISKYVDPPSDARIPRFDFEHFSYHRLIQLYYELFGDEGVLVLPFEFFQRDGRRFVSKIQAFAGSRGTTDLPYDMRVNTAPSAATTAIRKRLNVVNTLKHPTSLNPEALTFPGSRLVGRLDRVGSFVPRSVESVLARREKAMVKELVAGRYAESNRETARITGLDLESLGYDF